ncbi:hypothetical protein [Streptomyces sp. NPDC013187]
MSAPATRAPATAAVLLYLFIAGGTPCPYTVGGTILPGTPAHGPPY